MKRLLLLFSLLVCFAVWADSSSRTRSYTFCFDEPEHLTPSLKRASGEGGTVPLTDSIYTSSDGLLTMSFYKSDGVMIGVELVTNNAANGMIPFLKIARNNGMTLTANGAAITQVKIPGADVTAALNCVGSTPATKGILNLNKDYSWYRWPVDTANELITDQSFSSVTFYNTAVKATEIHQIYVEYELPSDYLTPRVSLDEGAELKSFKDITLTFTENISAVAGAKYTLTNANGKDYPLAATINGNSVTFSPMGGTITDLGEYTLNVAAGSFMDSEDVFRNTEVVRHFKIVENKATFNYTDVSPTVDEVEKIKKISDGIILTFSGIVGKVDNTKTFKIVDAGGSTVKNCTATNVTDSSIENYNRKVKIKYNNPADITGTGVYKLTIPEGIIYDVEDNYYNPEIVIEYNIGKVAPDEIRAKADSLLALTGPGYPTTTSAARSALAALVGVGTTDEFNDAIRNYYASTDIEMPITGNYYQVAAQNNAGTLAYLSYTGDAITLTTNADQAAAFKATANNDGTVTLATLDGKFLHNLVASNVVYTGTSTRQLTDTYNATLNNLKLSRLDIDGLTPEQSFGLLSLYGSLGTNAGGITMNAYGLVNVSELKVATDASLGLVYYTDGLTNAFRLSEVSKSALPVPDAAYEVTPKGESEVDALQKVTITFPQLIGVTMSDLSKIYAILHRDNNTEEYHAKSAVALTGTSNSFDVTFEEMPAGNFTVVFDKGAFTYTYEETKATVQTITVNYKVNTGVDFIRDLINLPTTHVYDKYEWTSYIPVKDTDLNDFTLWSDDTELWPDSTSKVVLRNFNTLEIVATGTFRQYDDPELPNNKNHKGCIRLTFDNGKRIEEGSLETGTYIIAIPAVTFGDANFGKYLAGTAGVVKTDCHVNDYLPYVVLVNNATGGNEHPSKEVYAKAIDLLKNVGVGYPSKNSPARTALQELVASGKGSDTDYKTKMASFVEDTNIEKPANGGYYTIKAVSADSAEVYVAYSNGMLSLTQSASEASVFQTDSVSDGIILKPLDGKYLSVLSPDGLSTTIDATHTLQFTRLMVSGVDAEKTFGLMSITGLKDNSEVSAKVNIPTLTILPPASAKVFTTSETSAFRLTKISEADIPDPTPNFVLTPADNSVLETFQGLTVSFTGADNISVSNSKLITLIPVDGNSISATSVAEKEPGTFAIVFPTDLESGTYTLNIGKGAFTFNFMQRLIDIEAITATYTLNLHPSTEMMRYAKDVLANKGIGYPVDDSDARLALQRLVADSIGSNTQFLNAINAYYAEINIKKPASGKFYRIQARSNKKESFLGYDNGVITLTNNQKQAAPFKATVNADGTTSLMTIDDKYLMLLAKDGSNVSENPVNLTIGRLVGSDLGVESTYGLLSMQGEDGFATVDLSVPASFCNPQSSAQKDDYITSGFSFLEISKDSIDMPDLVYTLCPAVVEGVPATNVESLEKVTLTFNTKVTLADKSLITLKMTNDSLIAPLRVDSVKDNEYVLTFINLNADVYTLIIDKGAFTTTFLGGQRPVQRLSAVYSLTKSVKFVEGYEKDIQLSWTEDPQDEYMMDSELNTFTLVSSVPLSFNPDKAVIIRNANSYQEVTRGHMVPVDKAHSNVEGIADYAYGLVLDKPITEGSLEPGKYAYVFEKELFGDPTFGEYLLEPTQVSKADCHVNGELIYNNVKVNNAYASVLTVDHTISPAAGSVEAIDKVTLTFNTDDKVTLADSTLLSLTISGKPVEPKEIKMTDDKTCELTFVNLEAGTYYLTVVKGAFTINHRGKERQVDGFMVSYTLTKSVDFATGYEKKIELTWKQDPKGQYVKDSDLNRFTLLSNTPLVINPNKTVIIRDASYYTEVACGHMEMDPVDKVRGNAEATADYVYTLVLDQQIAENSLSASTYEYVLAKETFGDATYGDYLVNPTKVSKADCHVNAEMRFEVNVNNKIAVGVREIGADADDAPVYDVYGRKVSGQLKKGTIYVKNGKKFIKK